MKNNSQIQNCYFQSCFFTTCKNANQLQPSLSQLQFTQKQKISLKKNNQSNRKALKSKRTQINGAQSLRLCKKSLQQITRSNTERPLNICVEQDFFNSNRKFNENYFEKKCILSSREYTQNQNKIQNYQFQRTKSNFYQPIFIKQNKNLNQIRSSPNFKENLNFLRPLHLKKQQFIIPSRLYSSESIVQIREITSFQNSPQKVKEDSQKKQLDISGQTLKSFIENSIIEQRQSESIIQIDFFNPSEHRLQYLERYRSNSSRSIKFE